MRRPSIRLACLLGCLTAAAVASDPEFLARRDYPPISTGGIAVADVNGDGIPDVIGLGPQSGKATVLFGNGKGTFQQGPTSQLTIINTIFNPVMLDLNGDGNVDLVTSGGEFGGGFGVCFGNGDGTFQTAVYYAAGTDMYVANVILGDFNGDGIPDAVTVGESGIWLFTGKGGGAFNSGVLTPMASGGEVVAADFNNDGHLDLAITTSTGFAVVLGNGNGTFQPPQAYNVADLGYVQLAVGDLNLDGRPDIVVSGHGERAVPKYVWIYLANDAGGFSGPTYAELPGAGPIAIGDVNGDGIPDLAGYSGDIALGRGDGTFKPPTYHTVPSGPSPVAVVLADLRNNGRNDLITQDGDEELSVLLNFGDDRFEDGQWFPFTSSGGGCGAAADYNGDGTPDLAVNNFSGISILLGTGQAFPAFKYGATIPLPGAGCLVTGDLNNDGIPDLLVPLSGSVVAYLGNGDGTFIQAGATSTPPGCYDGLGCNLALGDFNHDGKLDFATSGNLIAYGNGDGTFQAPVPIVPGLSNYNIQIAAADVNGDGWTDLLIDTEVIQTSYLILLLNNQHGGFAEKQIHLVNSTGGNIDCGRMVLTDLNGDGNLDIVFGGFLGHCGYVYLGNGKGGFEFKDILYAPLNPYGGNSAVVVSDLNGDGILDIALTAGTTVNVYLGKGDAPFSIASFYIGAGLSPGDLLLENLHGQPTGFPDMVAPDAGGGVMVLINATNR